MPSALVFPSSAASSRPQASALRSTTAAACDNIAPRACKDMAAQPGCAARAAAAASSNSAGPAAGPSAMTRSGNAGHTLITAWPPPLIHRPPTKL
ncbi:Uncharacterised protein [Mycobacteroides abscessus subsp. abscessus]|nr:Uncharacterised protein [Mycobacteroides abscessus subsp. abscessus]